jgi:hypothetical protein
LTGLGVGDSHPDRADDGEQNVAPSDLLAEMLGEIHPGRDIVDVDEDVAFGIVDIIFHRIVKATNSMFAVVSTVADEDFSGHCVAPTADEIANTDAPFCL